MIIKQTRNIMAEGYGTEVQRTPLVLKDFGWAKVLRKGDTQIERILLENGASFGVGELPTPADTAIADIELPKEAGVLAVMPQKRFPLELLLDIREIMDRAAEASLNPDRPLGERLGSVEIDLFILWDKETKEYRLDVPIQTVSGAACTTTKETLEERYLADPSIIVAGEFHSHPGFGSFFSGADEECKDLLSTRVYGNIAFNGVGPSRRGTNKLTYPAVGFGKMKCKFPGMLGDSFLDPNIFFEDLPSENEEVVRRDLSEELEAQLKEVEVFNFGNRRTPRERFFRQFPKETREGLLRGQTEDSEDSEDYDLYPLRLAEANEEEDALNELGGRDQEFKEKKEKKGGLFGWLN